MRKTAAFILFFLQRHFTVGDTSCTLVYYTKKGMESSFLFYLHLILLAEIRILLEQFSEFFGSDTTASYCYSLVVECNYIVNPTFGLVALQGFDLKSRLLNIRFKSLLIFCQYFCCCIQTSCCFRCIARYFIKIEYDSGSFIIADLKTVHGFNQTG